MKESELNDLQRKVEGMVSLLEGYEELEADFIIADHIPIPSEILWKMLELQKKRNEVLERHTAATQPKKEEGYSELREDLKIYQSLYEQSQSQLSQMTQRCEAAEAVIGLYRKRYHEYHPTLPQYKEYDAAYDKGQLLKSSTQQTETKSTE